MAGFRSCPLIPWLALAAVLGSVLGLGEDLDRPLFGPPGSPVQLHESDPGLKKALAFAEERYNRGSNAMHLRKVSRLLSATKQVTLTTTTTKTSARNSFHVNLFTASLVFCHNMLVWIKKGVFNDLVHCSKSLYVFISLQTTEMLGGN